MQTPTIIGLSGKKGSGKDVAFEFIRSVLQSPSASHSVIPVIRLAFANPLKMELARKLNCSIEWIEENKNSPSIRGLLQSYGSYRRDFFGADYWIQKWKAALETIRSSSPSAVIVVTDLRYQNEYDVLKELGAQLWRIEPINKDIPRDAHPSETELDSVVEWDAVLSNDFLDIYKLKEQITKTLS